MAKFRNGDLLLKDAQNITFGDGYDSNIWWDGTANELRLDTTISGVDPTQDYQLTTKYYVDGEIDTLSGTIPYSHSGLLDLDSDDHLQYVPRDGSRGFTSTVSGIDPTQDYHLTTKYYVDQLTDHGNLSGLGDDDHLQYVPRTGVRGFTSTVSGVDPTQDYHLTTKWYVDDVIDTLSGTIPYNHSSLTGLGADDHTQYSLVDGTRAFTGVVGGITPTQPNHLTTKQYVDNTVYNLDWQNSVISIVPVASGVQTIGNRYIASATGGGWTAEYIYEWNGTTWSGIEPNEGFATWVEDLDSVWTYNGPYPTGEWVRFGSTVTHNYLNGLQGGITDEYYHLSQSQYDTLISGTSIDDASGEHHHDSRYYTESEIDTELLDYVLVDGTRDFTGIQNYDAHPTFVSDTDLVDKKYVDDNITVLSGTIPYEHDQLIGLADDDHLQYVPTTGVRGFTGTVSGIDPTQDYHLTTKWYVDQLTDHGNLSGLGDDDHLQYVPTDASRGFTATVSGIDPTLAYHLATKSYVDAGGVDRHGRQVVANGASTVSVSFADLGHTNYTVNVTLENTTDSPPSIYPFIVSGKTSAGFTVTFAGDMDSVNYYIDWSVIED